MKSSEEIRKIWEEMKELKKFREGNTHYTCYGDSILCKRKEELEEKYEDIETLFGHESTLSKAIIYYMDEKHIRLQRGLKDIEKI